MYHQNYQLGQKSPALTQVDRPPALIPEKEHV